MRDRFKFKLRITAHVDLLPRAKRQDCVVKSRAVSVEKPGRK